MPLINSEWQEVEDGGSLRVIEVLLLGRLTGGIFRLSQQFGHGNTQCAGNTLDVSDGQIPLPPFHRGDVVGVQACAFSYVLLSQLFI